MSLTQLSRNLSLVVFVDKTNSNIALRVFRHFFLPQFVKDAWLRAWVIHAGQIRATWLAVVEFLLGSVVLKITRNELPRVCTEDAFSVPFILSWPHFSDATPPPPPWEVINDRSLKSARIWSSKLIHVGFYQPFATTTTVMSPVNKKEPLNCFPCILKFPVYISERSIT